MASNSRNEISARKILYPFQRRFVEDRSIGIVWEASRQIGKTFSLAFKAVLETSLHPRPIESVYGSASGRQSLKAAREARKHIKVLRILTQEIITSEKESTETIVFPGDKLLHFVPSNPDTIRGFSGNVYLDEFAFHKDDRAIWKAIFPAITRGYKIRIASTHKGKKTKFFELTKNPKYSHHRTTIYDAVAEGLKIYDEDGNEITPEDLRGLLGDDEAWEEEYLVVAADETTAFLTHEMISLVENDLIDPEPPWVNELINKAEEAHRYYKRHKAPPKWWQTESRELTRELAGLEQIYGGMDIGRKQDLSVIWLLEEKEALAQSVTQAVITLRRKPFYVQRLVLFSLLELPNFRRVAIDESGIGAQLAEEARDAFGSAKVEGIPFSNANKEMLAGTVRDAVEDLAVQIPKDQIIHRSLHSVKRYPTPAGHFRFDADKTEETGHADHFWALALALYASSRKGQMAWPPSIRTARRREALGLLRGYDVGALGGYWP